MQVGDLIRDIQFNDIGIVVEINEGDNIYKILFPSGLEWLTDNYIEVINESR